MACGLTSCPICERKAGSGLMEGKDAVRDASLRKRMSGAIHKHFPFSAGSSHDELVTDFLDAALSQGQQTKQGSRNG